MFVLYDDDQMDQYKSFAIYVVTIKLSMTE